MVALYDTGTEDPVEEATEMFAGQLTANVAGGGGDVEAALISHCFAMPPIGSPNTLFVQAVPPDKVL